MKLTDLCFMGNSIFLGNRYGIITWKLTSNCNLTCPYCSERIGNDNSNYSDVISAISSIKKDNIFLTLTGGEVLLLPEIYQIIDTLQTNLKDKCVQYKLMSNGTHTSSIYEKLNLPEQSIVSLTYHPFSEVKILDFIKIITILTLKKYTVDVRIPMFGDINKQKYRYYALYYLNNTPSIFVYPKMIHGTTYEPSIIDWAIQENNKVFQLSSFYNKEGIYHSTLISKDEILVMNRELICWNGLSLVNNKWSCYIRGINTFIDVDNICYSCLSVKHDGHSVSEMVELHNSPKWIICPAKYLTPCGCGLHIPKYKIFNK